MSVSNLIRSFARGEFRLLESLGALPFKSDDRVELKDEGTLIYDASGRLLFERIPFSGAPGVWGYIDVARRPALGAALLTVAYGVEWDEVKIVQAAKTAAMQNVNFVDDNYRYRFVAYAYPRVGIRFMLSGGGVSVLDWINHEVVAFGNTQEGLVPRLEQWSLLGRIKGRALKKRRRRVLKYIRAWVNLISSEHVEYDFNQRDLPELLLARLASNSVIEVEEVVEPAVAPGCQGKSNWCVPASLEMIYIHYNRFRAQATIANDLMVIAGGIGLPEERFSDVVRVALETHGDILDAKMVESPAWNDFLSELGAERPLISFIPGHSRVIVGAVGVRIGTGPVLRLKKLYVNDPNCCNPSNYNTIFCVPATKEEDFGKYDYDFNFNFKRV